MAIRLELFQTTKSTKILAKRLKLGCGTKRRKLAIFRSLEVERRTGSLKSLQSEFRTGTGTFKCTMATAAATISKATTWFVVIESLTNC